MGHREIRLTAVLTRHQALGTTDQRDEAYKIYPTSRFAAPCVLRYSTTTDYGPLTTDFLGGSLQPGLSLVFQGFVAEGHASRFAAATTDTLVCLNIDGILLVHYGVDSADVHGVTVFAIMGTDDI
jgi:hypothetical protein